MKTISLILVLFLAVLLAHGNMSITSVKQQKNADSLVAYFPFNGNANDESGNGHNGTIYGATITTDRYNLAGKAYNFIYNGFSSDKIELTGTSDFNFTSTGFTLSAWVKFSGEAGTGNNYPIISKHICGQESGYILMLYNGKLTFWMAGSGGYNVLSTSNNYTDDNWHHVAAVYDGNTQSIYVDGVLKNSIAFSYNNFNVANLALGGYNGCNGGFNGKVDEVKIFKQPLTAEEIQTEYNHSKTTLVAYFPFNGNANDESGNGSNPTYIGSGVTLTTDRFGNPDKAYYFDGNADSYIRIPADNFPTTDRTISFWFNADQVENHPTPLSYGGETCNNSVLMIINKGGYPNAYIVLSHCGSNFITAPYSEEPVNNWYYLTMTISGSTQKIFINGELQQTANTFGTPTVVAGKSAIFGAILFTDGVNVYNEPTAGNFQGKLDDFRFYNIALTDSEALNLYNNEANGIVAYYPFNGNANDESGNMLHGSVNGATLTTDRFGTPNSAYNFDGNDIITIAYNDKLNADKELTISVWVKPNVLQDALILGKSNWWTQTNYLIRTKSTGFLQFEYRDMAYNTNNPLIAGQWNHIAVVSDASNSKKVYINNVLATHTGGESPFNMVPEVLTIGGASYGSEYFNGAIDDVRIYKSALTAASISDLYTYDFLNIHREKNEEMNHFYVFNNSIYFKSTQNLNDIKTIEIYNLLGQKVFHTNNITKQILLSNLQKGVYVLKAQNKNGKHNNLKFVIE